MEPGEKTCGLELQKEQGLGQSHLQRISCLLELTEPGELSTAFEWSSVACVMNHMDMDIQLLLALGTLIEQPAAI